MKSKIMTKGNFQSAFKQIISLLISICIIGQGSSAYAVQTPKQQREEFVDYLKEEQDRYKTLFDQEALLEALDYDTDKIIDFVSNKIVYQAYDGVLRGAKGTLIGRAGNSHDQAITLAGMLNDAGLEAEILVGKLTVEQATELNLTIASPQFTKLKDTMSSSKSVIAKKIYAEVYKSAKTSGENISVIMEETDALAERVFQQIPEEKIKKGMEVFKKSVLSSAISYRWIRYRLAQGEKWVEVHPAYSGAKKWNITPDSVEKNKINPEDLQQFSVDVWIENSAGEKHSISGLWKKPSANLLDHTLSIEIVSDAMMNNGLSNKPEEILKNSRFFFIQIDGKLPKEGKVFDLNGNLYPGDSLSGLNSVFSTVNKKSQKAADALSSLSFNNKSKVSSKKQLTKVWLEFTLEKPNTKSRNIKRVIFDDNALNETRKATMTLLQRWDIDIATTIPMQQFYQHKKSEQVVAVLDGAEKFQEYVKNNPNAKQEEVIEKYNLAMGNPNTTMLTHKRSLFDRYGSKKTKISYFNEPYILAVRHGFNRFKTEINLYEMTDIISNQRWSFENIDKKLLPSPKEGIKRGVWETRTEAVSNIKQSNLLNRESAFNKLIQTNEYSLKNHIKTTDLKLYDNSESAWWNIDLETGSTVGMLKTSYGEAGADSIEYLILLSFAISFGLFNYGIHQCMTGPKSEFTCCMLVNTATWVGSILLGFAAGIYVTSKILVFGTDQALNGGGFAIGSVACKGS